MAKKYYLDACIWIDYLEDRKDKFRPLGDWALMLINKILDEDSVIVISNHLVNELRKTLTEEKIKSLIGIFPKYLIEYIEFTDEHSRKASKIKKRFGIPACDALHLVLAKEKKALLVTRDQHFELFTDIACIRKPEELI